jgi:hypothetical protein
MKENPIVDVEIIDKCHNKHIVHESVVGGSSLIKFPPCNSLRDMPGIEPVPLDRSKASAKSTVANITF